MEDTLMDEQVYSLKTRARIVFLSWALYAAPAIFSLQYVRPKLIISENAVATVNNILTHQLLFRMGIVSHLIAQVFLLFSGWPFCACSKGSVKHGRPFSGLQY